MMSYSVKTVVLWNIDPSHYIVLKKISSIYGIVVISVTYCVFNYIHNTVMSLQILRKVAVS